MNRLLFAVLALSLGLAVLAPQATTAQNEDNATAKKKTEYRGPLPFYFGKLGLDDEQKKELYAIDDEYEGKIEALEKQIEKLKDERDSKMEVLLTPGQKLRLKELREAAAKKEAKESQAKPAAATQN